jgi:DNA-binding phage protein
MSNEPIELEEFVLRGRSPFGLWFDSLEAVTAAKITVALTRLKEGNVSITRSFKDTVQNRAARDPEFRRALLAEAVNELIAGDFHVAKTILRDYINATITFPKLAEKLNKDSKSIHRMLGPKGNPRMDSITGILKVLQDQEHIRLQAKV